MTIEKVKAYLAECGLGDRVTEFDVSSATVELAAQALGCEPCLIAKTMSFLVDDHVVLVVLAGDARIDNAKFKAFFHQKAKMLSHEQVSEMTGFPVGGVCPFLAPEGTQVYLIFLSNASRSSIPPQAAATAPSDSHLRNSSALRSPRLGWTWGNWRKGDGRGGQQGADLHPPKGFSATIEVALLRVALPLRGKCPLDTRFPPSSLWKP